MNESTYTLYGSRRSGSLIVELALAEMELAYEVSDIDLDTGAQLDDTYAAINPQRKIPAMVTPEGETLTESVAILLTLEERHPDRGLLPPVASPQRAQALRWLLFVAAEIYPMVEINDYPERFVPTREHAPAVRERARAIWRERWLIVEAAIVGEPWLLASGCCATDLCIAVVSRWAQQDDWRAANVPKVESLTAAVATRNRLAAVWQRHLPSTPPARFAH